MASCKFFFLNLINRNASSISSSLSNATFLLGSVMYTSRDRVPLAVSDMKGAVMVVGNYELKETKFCPLKDTKIFNIELIFVNFFVRNPKRDVDGYKYWLFARNIKKLLSN